VIIRIGWRRNIMYCAFLFALKNDLTFAAAQRTAYLLPHLRVVFTWQGVLKCARCLGAPDAAQRPGGMTAHQRLRVVQRAGQGGYRLRVADVAQRHAYVAQQPAPLRAPDGAMPEALAEFFFGQCQQWY